MACASHAKSKSYAAQCGAVLVPELALCFSYDVWYSRDIEKAQPVLKKEVIFLTDVLQ